MSSNPVEENPLRLTHCMRCGYCLETLPPEGNCPECGMPYDQGIVVLKGMWSGNGGVGTGSRGAMVCSILAFSLWVFYSWTMHGSGNHIDAIIISSGVAAWLLVELTFRLSAKRAADGGALQQCRFNCFGCLQCDVPEETVGLDYRGLWRLVMLFAFAACMFAGLFLYPGFRGWIGFVLVVLLIELIELWRWRRAMNFAQQDPNARALMTAARDRGRQVVASPWSAIKEIRVGQFRGKLFRDNSNRWYLRSIPAKGRPKREQVINCEVEATSDQIRELQSQIAQWQAEAGTGR